MILGILILLLVTAACIIGPGEIRKGLLPVALCITSLICVYGGLLPAWVILVPIGLIVIVALRGYEL